MARVTEDPMKVAPPNQSPEAGIAKAEKRLGARTNVRNLDQIVAIQKRNIPLNGKLQIRGHGRSELPASNSRRLADQSGGVGPSAEAKGTCTERGANR